MALADIEAQLTDENIPWRTCGVCHHMSERGDPWATQLRALLGNRGIGFKALAAALEADPDEPTIPWETLSRHARAGCAARERLR